MVGISFGAMNKAFDVINTLDVSEDSKRYCKVASFVALNVLSSVAGTALCSAIKSVPVELLFA
jgi:hypothetical protein